MKTMFLLAALVGCADPADPAIDPATCEVTRVFHIDAADLPRTATEARAVAHDLDANHTFDNQLGMVTSTLRGLFAEVPLDLSATATAHLTSDTDWQIAVANCPHEQRLIALTSGEEALVPEIAGTVIEGTIHADGQTAQVPVTALFDGLGTTEPVFVDASRVMIEMADPTGDELDATIGLAIGGADRQVIHALTPFLSAHLDFGRDTFDLDHDGAISEAEVAANTYAQALLGPDVEIAGVPALSFGLRVHATRR